MKTKLVIFGITGDLSRRKLLPALSELARELNGDDLSIIGVSRRDVVVSELLRSARSESLAERTSIFTMDLAEARDYRRLSDHLQLQPDEQAVIYLAVPPNAAASIVDFLGQSGLTTPNVKILFEKPFGFDLASAEEFIERTGRYYEEEQLYRIDHYMAKEVAKEIIHLRSQAESKHRGWSNQTVASIEVVASETLGIEDRAHFYEQTGALRDVVQGHLMQLLSLALLSIPDDFTMAQLPALRLEALSQINPADPGRAYRAQYEGYQDEAGNPGSMTETFVTVALSSGDPRWQGVELTLATGKKLAVKRTAIRVRYHDGSEDVFEEGKILREERIPDAYESVLAEAIGGRKSIFTTSPEVIRSWEILAPVQEAWGMDDQPLPLYVPGSPLENIGS